MLLGGWMRGCEADHAEVRLAVILLVDSEELYALAFGHSQQDFHGVAVLQSGIIGNERDLATLGGLGLREGVLGRLFVLTNSGFGG